MDYFCRKYTRFILDQLNQHFQQQKIYYMKGIGIELTIPFLTAIKDGLIANEGQRHYQGQSHQEYMFYNTEYFHRYLFDSLISITPENSALTSTLDNIAINHHKYSSYLLTFCTQITDIFEEASFFSLSHKNYISHSVLLALFLAKFNNTNIDLVISQESLARSGHYIAGKAEEDKLTYARRNLQKDGVIIYNLNEWNKQGCQLQNKITIIDFFGINPMNYAPFLFKNVKVEENKKIFVYHSHLQDEQIAHLLEQVGISPFLLQLWPAHPVQQTFKKDQKQAISYMINFLRQDYSKEKQDVVIFYPPDQNLKRYSMRLHEQLSKNSLRDRALLITKAHQIQTDSKSNIFIVKSVSELLDWNYDYSNIVNVIDYGLEVLFNYDYRMNTFVRYLAQSSKLQKANRMSLVGVNRVGRYIYLSKKLSQNMPFSHRVKELSSYVLKMIDYGLAEKIDRKDQRTSSCLEILEQKNIIKNNNDSYVILDEKIIRSACQGISPIQAQIIYEILKKSPSTPQILRQVNLTIMGLVVIECQESLRQQKNDETLSNIRPNSIWKTSGYIQSCLDILTKCQYIEMKKRHLDEKKEMFRRKSSHHQYKSDMHGNLQIESKQKLLQHMEISDLVKFFNLNEDILNKLRDKIQHYRDVFQVEETMITLEPKDVSLFIKNYISHHKNATAVYSGSRKYEYTLKISHQRVPLDKTCLFSKLNERPELLLILSLAEVDGKILLLTSNSFAQQLYLEIYGELPIKKKESKSDVEVEFHGISSLAFAFLSKNEGIEIQKFQNENGCFIEPNEQMDLITIHCNKEKSLAISARFQEVLAKIKQNISVSSKQVHYLGSTSLHLGAGGVVRQIIKGDYINKCLLANLHLEVTRQDLLELFEQFVSIKNIAMVEPEFRARVKQALITFHSQQECSKFYQYFNQCVFFDNPMEVRKMKDEEKIFAQSKQYIDFKWFVWKSHGKALATFVTVDDAKKAYQGFETNPLIDGKQVKVSVEGNKLYLRDLKISTDEIVIEDALRYYGEISEIQIQRTPLKQITFEDYYLKNLIISVGIKDLDFKINEIEKKKNGLRVCRVMIPDIWHMNQVANTLNKKTHSLGEGRLYAQIWFQVPILVPQGYLSVYQELLDKIIEKFPSKPIITIEEFDSLVYIVLKSRLEDTINLIHRQFTRDLNGFPLNLAEQEKDVLLTDIGLANIIDLEQKYQCKLIINVQNKSINVVISEHKLKHIEQQIKERVKNNFFYQIVLSSKAFKYFRNNPHQLEQIKVNYSLSTIEMEPNNKTILIEGSALQMQKAINFLMHFIQSLAVTQEKMVNADVCGICCLEPHRPYRLQNCSHKFCKDCLLGWINMALGDNSLFPLKCPHCSQLIVIDDLQFFLETPQWTKLQTLALNQFVPKCQDLTFCFTAGCKQINTITGDFIKCDVCQLKYCIKCKLRYHPDLNCEDAKMGVDALFEKYIKLNNVRRCANKKCNVPVVRNGGCYRILCSRCGKSMCFKCDPDKMIPYDTQGQCYQHLDQIHGGHS